MTGLFLILRHAPVSSISLSSFTVFTWNCTIRSAARLIYSVRLVPKTFPHLKAGRRGKLSPYRALKTWLSWYLWCYLRGPSEVPELVQRTQRRSQRLCPQDRPRRPSFLAGRSFAATAARLGTKSRPVDNLSSKSGSLGSGRPGAGAAEVTAGERPARRRKWDRPAWALLRPRYRRGGSQAELLAPPSLQLDFYLVEVTSHPGSRGGKPCVRGGAERQTCGGQVASTLAPRVPN